MTNKMTNKKALEFVLENMSEIPTDVREKLENMISSLERKSTTGTRKPTAKQIENAGLRNAILRVMAAEPNRLFTCTEIGKLTPGLENEQNQRVSALMRPLVDSKAVEKISEKGKSLFRINMAAEVEDEVEG